MRTFSSAARLAEPTAVMNGWQFRTQQQNDPALACIPVLILSALEHDPTTTASLARVESLRKPIECDHLLLKVHQYCSGLANLKSCTPNGK